MSKLCALQQQLMRSLKGMDAAAVKDKCRHITGIQASWVLDKLLHMLILHFLEDERHCSIRQSAKDSQHKTLSTRHSFSSMADWSQAACTQGVSTLHGGVYFMQQLSYAR